MDKEEIKLLANRLDELCNHIPIGLWDIKDAVTFASIDLRMYVNFGRATPAFQKALTFAKSIPDFTDFESDECFQWMMNDEEFRKYRP